MTGLLLLTLFMLESGKTMGYAHSLCLDLAVTSQSRPGQPWCEVQGSMDTKPLLQYDSDSNQVTASGPLGEEVNGTKAWRDLTGTLGGVGRELRMVLPVIQLGTEETRGAPRLQAKLCCQLEAERVTAASWHFSLDGQTALLLDAMDMNWTLVNPGATGIKEQWQKDQDLAEYFRKLAVGDCGHWLREFLGHWENVLEQEPTEPPLEPSDNQQLPAWIIPHSGLTVIVVLVLVVIVVIVVILVFIIRRCDRRSGTPAGEKQAGLRLLGSACSGKGLGDMSPALTQALCTDPSPHGDAALLCLEPHSAQRGWGLLGSWGRRGWGGGTSHLCAPGGWGAGWKSWKWWGEILFRVSPVL
uniref:MHC class I-like antigen recognition-like domain-containing protein n=1 Tax=Sus scrofa TaxID=9823 RepID=A0A8D1IYY3_PIG